MLLTNVREVKVSKHGVFHVYPKGTKFTVIDLGNHKYEFKAKDGFSFTFTYMRLDWYFKEIEKDVD